MVFGGIWAALRELRVLSLSGDILSIFDADDLMHPQRIELISAPAQKTILTARSNGSIIIWIGCFDGVVHCCGWLTSDGGVSTREPPWLCCRHASHSDLCVPVAVCVCVCLSLSVSLSLHPSLSISLCLYGFVSVSVPRSVSLFFSLTATFFCERILEASMPALATASWNSKVPPSISPPSS